MGIYRVDPTKDARWEALVQKHPDSSIFHTAAWLETLRRTYGYNPVVFTTSSPNGLLTNGLSFCEISNWFSGRRLVSLPFSDHCAPLVENSGQLTSLVSHLEQDLDRENWDSVEIRGEGLEHLSTRTRLGPNEIFFFHKLDLRPSLDDLFQSFHKDCIQRKIKRAEREDIGYEQGRSDSLLAKFYGLLLLTRRRHGLPPQPVAWFRNLIACLGDKVTIHVASKDGRPIASILTLRHKHALVYKYGCSDLKFSHLGGTQLLFWKAIQGAKENQLSEFDLGRSDRDKPGLVAFKDRWGAARSTLTYWRFPTQRFSTMGTVAQTPLVKHLVACFPDTLLVAAGRMFYKHIG
jgi:CelD/BcsL family acetyltransferase involved in cellulose biosynthesis